MCGLKVVFISVIKLSIIKCALYTQSKHVPTLILLWRRIHGSMQLLQTGVGLNCVFIDFIMDADLIVSCYMHYDRGAFLLQPLTAFTFY